MDVLPPKPPKVPRNTVPTSFRIPRDLLAELDQAAAEAGYTRTEMFETFLRFALAAHKQAKKSRGPRKPR